MDFNVHSRGPSRGETTHGAEDRSPCGTAQEGTTSSGLSFYELLGYGQGGVGVPGGAVNVY